MEKSIIQLVDELSTDNITVKVLKAVDYVAPSQWNNLVGFDNSIRAITGETDAKVIQKIRERAVALYQDPQQGYQSAIKLYQTIDKADTAMATAALANKIGEKIGFLSFLSNITPKADLTQTNHRFLQTQWYSSTQPPRVCQFSNQQLSRCRPNEDGSFSLPRWNSAIRPRLSQQNPRTD
jgi:hypothetical protein